ncbi:DUF1641 domain-containing protein [Sporolactobacillus sp. CQH2019]|uniref:DUF1641 domain-containing protein n=1 Tax=Sporolactobacillus sp. CQH2019 TaxID=3023512 RepID=UPI002367FAD9|nr:DUF1641 domain-containing protein [Sporolactobacillus sp. CQH2019]MDD9150262.1 DUF1641 domain-containing protein [Sporolactobacillus sp. CQH2019]
MESVSERESNETTEKIQGLINGAMQSVSTPMIEDTAAKAVRMIELADDVVQPETVDLMKKLPELSESLEKILDKAKRLEESGALDTLFQLSEMINAMKKSVTGPMITGAAEKIIRGVETADDLAQKIPFDGMIAALDTAKKSRTGQKPMSLFKIIRALSDPNIRQDLSFLLAFLEELPKSA